MRFGPEPKSGNFILDLIVVKYCISVLVVKYDG